MGLRHRSIRLRVGILIVVPVLCLIALYGFAVSITLGNALTEANAKTLKGQLLTPIGAFQEQLYQERYLAIQVLAKPDSTQLSSSLGTQEKSTGDSLTALEHALSSSSVMSDSSSLVQQTTSKLLQATRQLSSLRTNVADNAINMPTALAGYSAIVDDANQVVKAVLGQQPSAPIVTQALNVIGLEKVAQTTLEERDLLAGEIARGTFPLSDRIAFAQLASMRDSQLADSLPQLDPSYANLVSATVTPALSTGLATLETTVIRTPWRHGPPAQIAGASSVFMTYTTAVDGAVNRIGVDLTNRSQRSGDDVFAELFLAAGLGLLGTIVSIGLSVYIGRSLVRQLRKLRESALGLASDKLPAVIGQLRAGEAVDLSEYAAPGETGTRDEIEQVQYAFNVVQQTAVQAAVDEARLRRGIGDVFRNLAGRSQSLLHRQLTLLDGMERRATEPDELEDLFRIDHLTTRMRRHAEGLIILSGETPARGWRQPVPLVDVLRAAVAEVEDYTRIRVLSRTRAAVAGHAVADVIHLVAELAENATVFSPPNTPVRIQGDVVGRGFAIEIEDRGLGISAERLAEINADLANPPQFDLSDSDRLGLFITGQLAHRHGITVTLQPSVYGGTTAVVLLPTELVVDENAFMPDPALEAGPFGNQLRPGRHAALAAAERGLLTAGNGYSGGLAEDPGTGPASLSPVEQPVRLRVERLPQRIPVARADPSQDDLDARVTTSELAELGLPVRVRQASLAPQLRESGPAVTPADPPVSEPPPSPELARNMMSALQRGWQLGRAEPGELPEPAADSASSSQGDVLPAPAGPEPAEAAHDDADDHSTD